jgi:pyruvate,orthophosphate dikinase
MSKKYVYSFGREGADGNKEMKDTLGGKGANLAEMCNTGVPVPPGFTVSTEVCNIYFNNNRQVPSEVDDQIRKALGKVEKELGRSSATRRIRC